MTNIFSMIDDLNSLKNFTLYPWRIINKFAKYLRDQSKQCLSTVKLKTTYKTAISVSKKNSLISVIAQCGLHVIHDLQDYTTLFSYFETSSLNRLAANNTNFMLTVVVV